MIGTCLRNLIVTGLIASPACAVDYYVNPFGTYTTIQSAIAVAGPGDRVLIEDTGAPTSYIEDIDFLGKDIIVRSAPANTFEVTIVGTGTGPVVTIASGEPVTAQLHGLRITRGAAFVGGGVLIQNSGATLSEVSVERCTGSFGAGIAVVGSTAYFDNVKLLANNEPSLGFYGMFGGGLYAGKSSVTWKRGSLNDNRARYGGGLAAYHSKMQIVHVDFYYNDSDYGGGALLLEAKTPYLFDHCGFIANNARNIASAGASMGGGILAAGASVEIYKSEFVGNMSHDGPGGALTALKDSEIRMEDSYVVESYAHHGAGAYLRNGAFKAIRSDLSGNNAHTNGGGVQAEGHGAYFAAYECRIAYNSASRGGGVALQDYANMEMSLTEVLDNQADLGGGVYAYGKYGNRLMQSCYVYGNSAGAYGGGLFIQYAAPFTIAGQTFIEQNFAGAQGGGMFAYRAALLFDASRCCFNTAGGLGGGLRSILCSPTIQSSVISNNTATDVDGAIVNVGSSIGGGC